MEKWKNVVGFEKFYEVSDMGNIRNKKTGHILAPVKHANGYCFVTLSCNGEKTIVSIHRTVANAFVKNPQNKPQVNHKNGIKEDNRAENLEWLTCRENIRHAYDVLNQGAHGRPFVKGMIQKTRKFTDEQIRTIRKDKRNNYEIAADYGVDGKTIWSIKNGKTYKNVS